MQKIELLAPAGSLSRLITAINYGADAVYIGGEEFSLRESAENFSPEDMKKGIEFAHSFGKKVYVAANIVPHNEDIKVFPAYIKEVAKLGADAVIVSDLGTFSLVKEHAPNLDVHISTQANNVNFESAKMWHKLGAKRVVVARELSLKEIKEISENIPKDLEIEAFVHGAMCISYSGRCLLSNYMTGRDSNLGACAHPCRWKYHLMEETRPGEYMPVFENERGTFIYNSKDLCMIPYIPELIDAGITSFKIEGRVKTEYYVATVVKAYREAIDTYLADKENYKFDEKWLKELCKVSHREYTTGFYFGKPDEKQQLYTSNSYIRDYDLVAYIKDYDEATKIATIEQRNKFLLNDTVEIIQPKGDFFVQKIDYLTDEDGNPLESAPHARQILKIKLDRPVGEHAIIRKEKL